MNCTRLSNAKKELRSTVQCFSWRWTRVPVRLNYVTSEKRLQDECKVMQSFVRLNEEWFIYFQIQGGWITQMQLHFLYFRHSPVPSVLFSHTCLNLLWILIIFSPDANDYFASCPQKLIACERAVQKASLSYHSLERHVNCTYHLLGAVTHHHWCNLISDTFSPHLEHI